MCGLTSPPGDSAGCSSWLEVLYIISLEKKSFCDLTLSYECELSPVNGFSRGKTIGASLPNKQFNLQCNFCQATHTCHLTMGTQQSRRTALE